MCYTCEEVKGVYLEGLDPLDQKILEALLHNARYSYSQIGERVGVSRVAVKARMDQLQQRGIIEGYTVVIDPQKLSGAVSCYLDIQTRPDTLNQVQQALAACPEVTQVYRMTGDCRLHVHALAAGQAELERFLEETVEALPGLVSAQVNVILARIKDIKGLRL